MILKSDMFFRYVDGRRVLLRKDQELNSQSFLFVHKALPVLTFADPTKTMAILTGPDAQQFLVDAWNSIGKHCDESMHRNSDGLSLSVSPAGTTGLVVVVRLPEPTEQGEAYFAAIISRFEDPREPDVEHLKWTRLFTLELGTHPITNAECPMLCEWTPDGQHLNLGEGSSVDERDFVELTLDVLWQQTKKTTEAN